MVEIDHKKSDVLKGIAFLVVLGALCGGALHVANGITADAITLNRETAARAMIADLTGDRIASEINLDVKINAGCPDWLLIREEVAGYAGPIEFLIHIRPVDDTYAMRTTLHRETPGIGDFIDTRIDPYLQELDDAPETTWLNLDSVTGATVTSNALRDAFSNALAQSALICPESQDG